LYLVIIRVFYDYLKYDERVDLTNPVKRNHRLRVFYASSMLLVDGMVTPLNQLAVASHRGKNRCNVICSIHSVSLIN